MFAVTYVPQAAVLSIVNGPLAIFSTILLVFSESSTLLTVLSKMFLIEEALVDTFDGVSSPLAVYFPEESLITRPDTAIEEPDRNCL